MCTQINVDGDKEGVKTSPINGHSRSQLFAVHSIFHIYLLHFHTFIDISVCLVFDLFMCVMAFFFILFGVLHIYFESSRLLSTGLQRSWTRHCHDLCFACGKLIIFYKSGSAQMKINLVLHVDDISNFSYMKIDYVSGWFFVRVCFFIRIR